MDGTGGNSTENIGKYAIIGAAVVGVILYFTLTISFSVACFLCRKRPNRQGNEVRSQDSTVEPVRQEIQTRIHTLSSTVMDSNDRIALVYQLSSGSDTVFAMDVPQSSDLGSVYEEEAGIDSSNICTPDLPPRTEEMYLTTDGFPCFSRSPSSLPPPLHPLECSGEDIHYQVAPTTQAVWLTDPSNTTLPLEEHTPLSQPDPSNTTLPLEEHTPLSQQDPSNTTLSLEEHTPLSQQDPSNTTLEHTPLLQQSPPAMNNAHTVKTPCQQPSLTPVANEETDPLTFLHKEAPQRSDYENIVPPSTVQPSPTTLTPEHILLSQQQSVLAMNNVHTIKTPCQQPPLTPVLNEETSPSTFLHKESPHKADYKNIVPPSLQAVQPAVQPSPEINTTLTPEHIPLSQQQSAPAVTNAHIKPHSPCQQPPLTPVIDRPPPFLPREPSHIPRYENTVPSSLPPPQTPNLPASHHTVIELPPRHIRRYPLPSSGGEGDHKRDIFLKYNESYHSLMKHFHLF